jgi:hypothetical protein
MQIENPRAETEAATKMRANVETSREKRPAKSLNGENLDSNPFGINGLQEEIEVTSG